MTSTTPVDEIAEAMGAAVADGVSDEPNYNVAPTQQILVATQNGGDRQISRMRWGLVPFFAKSASGAAKMINARAESVADKPAYRRAFKKRRCLVPADGFYEWRASTGDQKHKQPFYMYASSGAPLAFAGLWETWHDPEEPEDASPLFSCTIITTEANDDTGRIHERMPVFLASDKWDTWLDIGSDEGHVRSLLLPPEVGLLDAYPVSTAVNSVRNNGPALIEAQPA